MTADHNQVIVHPNVITRNAALLKNELAPGVSMMAVVKANGYGHGLVQAAEAALRGGADALGVACAAEGEMLRQQGIVQPVLVLGLSSPEEMEVAVRRRLILTVCAPEQLHRLGQIAEALSMDAQVHLKIDTGMNRIGIRSIEEINELADVLCDVPRVHWRGAFTHFADADGEDETFTRQQFDRFMKMAEHLPERILLHCANSAAGLRFPSMHLHMVRFGIALYGYAPVPTKLSLRPAMTWQSRVTWVKEIGPEDTVGYGRAYVAKESRRIATIAWGYGDGYHRCSKEAYVLIRGQTAPVIGNICMDQMMVDVTHIPQIMPGDEVVLLGEQQGASIQADVLAGAQGTIPYEVMLSPSARVAKRWMDAEG